MYTVCSLLTASVDKSTLESLETPRLKSSLSRLALSLMTMRRTHLVQIPTYFLMQCLGLLLDASHEGGTTSTLR